MNVSVPTIRRTKDQPCYCYCFFGAIDRVWGRNEWMFVKVGVAHSVQRRLKTYHSHSPIPFSAGFCAILPSVSKATEFQNAFLADDDLRPYNEHGEWFSVNGGPEDHVVFMTYVLRAFYIMRFADQSTWNARLEWVIVPDETRVSEIPRADETYLCGPEDGAGLLQLDHDFERVLELGARAEAQAEALGRIIYPDLDDQ